MSNAAALFDDATRGATVSPCGRYRYDLWRRWDTGPLLGWVMLNPSTADDLADDRTIRRCIGFARREGMAGIVVRTLFAYRTPKPADLRAAIRHGVDVVGPDNDDWLRHLAGDRFAVRRIVAAWGSPGRYAGDRIAFVRQLFAGRLERLVVNGGPAAPHPLYLERATPLQAYEARGGP